MTQRIVVRLLCQLGYYYLMKTYFRLLLKILFSTVIGSCCALIVVVLFANSRLPSVENLEDAQLQIPLRIYTQDGKLIGEYGSKRRTPVGIEEIPEKLKLAIIATEDRRFYEHHGVDLRGLARAGLNLVLKGTKEQGASTITMQVARNFYLTRKKTFARKLNEILLAMKIEKELDKDQILELYLNKIYFGKRAYGVQAAAYVYYGKPVNELNLAQMAMLAGLPQAPSAINPLNNAEAAAKRRAHVLRRMRHYEFISQQEYDIADGMPLSAKFHGRRIEAHAPYVAEAARQWAVERFGRSVYTEGREVYTTVDSKVQAMAADTVQTGLLEYDKRHGFRGPIGQIEVFDGQDYAAQLAEFDDYPKLEPAVITEVTPIISQAVLQTGQVITLDFETMSWARKVQDLDYLGPKPKSCQDVLSVGDVVYVQALEDEWGLSQLPEASSALVSLRPNDGAIQALVGGYDYSTSKFNRATQAYRQPGSNFKTLIYSAAIEHGFTPATIINDAPVVFKDRTLESTWRPQNASKRFYGPTRLRVGLTKSRNLVSIRLLQALGLPRAIETLEKFGFAKHRLPNGLSLALGTVTTTPMEIASSYAVFANGGYRVEPYLVDRVEDDSGELIYVSAPATVCKECFASTQGDQWLSLDEAQQLAIEQPTHIAPRVLSEQTAYIVSNILHDAIQSGTGRKARSLNRKDISGKTGSTNQNKDAWYSGYTPNLVTTVWVGFDGPKSLKEYGSQAALPIWIDYMQFALKEHPDRPLVEPPGIVRVRIDQKTGLLARPNQSGAMFEVFREGQAPQGLAPVIAREPQVTITPSSSSEQESLF